MDQHRHLDPQVQKKLQQNVVNSMIRDNMEMLLDLSEECFSECVSKFPSKTLDRDETSCIENCADRYLKLRLRVGQKFQYYQAVKVQEMRKKKEQEEISR
mmetsp:Transcript_25882/g.31903  ORF Transcript_25882/g.31903 Transcript_25882/m.31903 type:complete len:100 (-) Transcript_25882:385-684(-)